MKSLTAVCQTGASMPAINPNGRITRHPPQRGDGENAEMKMYLSKLKDLVPFMPKNRKLSKLEIIQHVIDYICDLQTELEAHPEIGTFDAAAALNYNAATNTQEQQQQNVDEDEDMLAARLAGEGADANVQRQQQQTNSSPAITTRQPLADRQAPNTILPTTSHNNMLTAPAAQAQLLPLQQQEQQQQQQQPHLPLATAQSSQTHAAGKDSRQPC